MTLWIIFLQMSMPVLYLLTYGQLTIGRDLDNVAAQRLLNINFVMNYICFLLLILVNLCRISCHHGSVNRQSWEQRRILKRRKQWSFSGSKEVFEFCWKSEEKDPDLKTSYFHIYLKQCLFSAIRTFMPSIYTTSNCNFLF